MRDYYNKPNFTEIDPSFELTDFDGVDAAFIYYGSIMHLELINDKIKWRPCDEKTNEALGIDAHVITLKEIAEQVQRMKNNGIITVFIDSPMQGIILQHGNYDDGKWYKIGDYAGYA